MSSEEECLICFENITDDNKEILECNHIYHKICVSNWYKVSTQKDCPLCRSVITTINDSDNDSDNENDNENDTNNSNIANNNRFNEIFFSCQRKSLLLFIPANIFISVGSYISNINTNISLPNILIDSVAYIGTYTLDVNILYVYLILWFCKTMSILTYCTYELYTKNSLFTNNDLDINNLVLFSISEIISMSICIIVNELIAKINYYRRNYLNSV
jgi:hypothetical protein